MKEKIIEAVKNGLLNYLGLVNITLVGSHADSKKELEKTNDFDFIFIFEKLRPNNFKDFQNRLTHIAASLDQPSHVVWAEFRVGPIKPACPRPADFCSMIHALVFSRQIFQEYIVMAPFITLDWSQFPPLIGKSLREIFDFPWPTVENLIAAPRHSINFYRQSLKDKVSIAVKLVEHDGQLVTVVDKVPMNEQQILESCSNILNKVMLNTIIVYEKITKQWDKDQLLAEFLKLFPEFKNQKAELVMINDLKKKLRKGEPSLYSLAELEEKLEAFLVKLTELARNKAA